MPDVPPAGGSGDFNIQMAIARATSTNLITLPTALTTQVFYSDHPVADRAGLLAFDSPFRVVYTAAATGSSLGADQYLFAAAFAARRGFAKRWNPKRAFVLNGLAGEFLVVAFTNSQALFGNGLVLRGTLTWESRFGSG